MFRVDANSPFKPFAGQDFEWGLDRDGDRFLDASEVINESETGQDGSAFIRFVDADGNEVFCAREINVSEHFEKLVAAGCDDFEDGAEVVFKNQNKPQPTPVLATPSPTSTPGVPESFPPTGGSSGSEMDKKTMVALGAAVSVGGVIALGAASVGKLKGQTETGVITMPILKKKEELDESEDDLINRLFS